MRVKEDIDMSVRRSAVIDRVDRSEDQKLCPEGNAAHCHRVVRDRHPSARRRPARNTVALCAVAVRGDLKGPEIRTAGRALLLCLLAGCFLRCRLGCCCLGRRLCRRCFRCRLLGCRRFCCCLLRCRRLRRCLLGCRRFRSLLRCRCFCCRLLRCRRLRCCLLLCCLRSLLRCRCYGCLLFARLLLCSLLGRICRCLGCRLFSLLAGCFLRCKLSLKPCKKVFLFLNLRRQIRCRELLGADILRILGNSLICRSDQILYLSLSRLVLRF